MHKIKIFFYALASGLTNSLFGAGGGLIAVKAFKAMDLTQRQSQSCAIGVILPLCIVSATVYALKGYYNINDALPYLPFGLVGAFFGTKLLRKIPDSSLKKIFALFMIYTGIKMITR